MLCVFKKTLWPTCNDYLEVIILGLNMIICVSIDVPLHGGHGVLFGTGNFICVLVLSTFWICKVNGCFIIH